MIIRKNRILSLNKYLGHIKSDTKIYISVPANSDNKEILNAKCGVLVYEVGRKITPRECGPITRFNCKGRDVIYKDKEKESRVFERDYHVVDWHGTDHYGTCYQVRQCYPKGIDLPPLEGMILEKEVIRSELMSRTHDERILHVINLFLEVFGFCEILGEDEKPIDNNLKIKVMTWKILPPGKYPWNKAEKELEKYFRDAPNKNKHTIVNRHKVITESSPDFMAIGQDSFSGYVVYGYEKKELYIFESNQANNATYVFRGKWEYASKLTKRDIIQGKLCHLRIVHSKEWEKTITNLLS